MSFGVPSKEDFEAAKWQECIASADENTCFDYIRPFNIRGTDAEAAGHTSLAEVFRLLSSLVSLRLRSENFAEPFEVGASGPGWRWPSISDFSDDQLDVFAAILPDVSDAEMRARIADVLWVRKRGDYQVAQQAVAGYLDAARKLENHPNWHEGYERLERAINLAASIRGASLEAAVAQVDRILKDSENVQAPSFFEAKLLELLLKVRQGDPTRGVALATLHAERAESNEDWRKAQVYWDLVARWHSLTLDEEGARAARLREAETYVREAEAANSKSVAAHHLGQAIEAFRRVGNQRERVDELHRQMLDCQKEARKDFKQVSSDIDVSGMVRAAEDSVRGKEFGAALFTLCVLTHPRRMGELRKKVEESAKKFLFMSLFPTAILNSEGKVVARHGPIAQGRGLREEDTDAVLAQMYANANQHRHVVAIAVIEPARRAIVDEHYFQPSQFLPLVSNNPFVPAGREYIFAKGLHAGFVGDFGVALHLLMPQVENSIRCLLAGRGVIVSTFTDGIQQEKDLNTLLFVPEAEQLFGLDLLFDLKGLLISRFGANLRNLMAHGLLSSSDTYSTQSGYFWWMVLRLICYPFITGAVSGEPDSPAQAPSGEEQ